MPSSADCPACGSGLVQPLRWQAGDCGEILVELRCPECHSCAQVIHTQAEIAALDRAQADARQSIVDAYERVVAEAMEALAVCLRTALDLDLVGADDFLPRRRARAT